MGDNRHLLPFWILDFGFWIAGALISQQADCDQVPNPKSKI
jgi:hypothetical protein